QSEIPREIPSRLFRQRHRVQNRFLGIQARLDALHASSRRSRRGLADLWKSDVHGHSSSGVRERRGTWAVPRPRPRAHERQGRGCRNRRQTMREIIAITQVSVDGVMQAPGGPEEDPENGFTLGGWAMPFVDDDANKVIGKIMAGEFDMLLGRRTYEIFAGY